MLKIKKIEKIHDDIYLIGGSGLSGPGDCLVYLIESDEGLILIDCGVNRSSAELILNNIDYLNLNINSLKYLILTHCHIDHIGAAYFFQNRLKLKIITHNIESVIIEGNKHPEWIGADFYGVEYKPCRVDIKLQGNLSELSFGDKILRFLFTPGHTPGGISPFLDFKGKRILFGQDIHGPLMRGFGSNLKDYLNSMQKLLDLNADILCEGHFGIYKPSNKVKEYIQKYINHYSR